MNFTLGKREQILLLLLVLVALWVLSAKFLMLPAFEAYQANLQAVSDLQAKKTEMAALIAKNKMMDGEIEKARQKAQETSQRFFPPFENEQLNLWLFGYTEQAGLRNLSVNIGGTTAVQISPYTALAPELRIALSDLVDQINGTPLPVGSSATEAPPEDTTKFVYVNTVTVTADCYYENLLYFIDLIWGSGRTVSISGINFTPRQDDSGIKNVITAEITLQVYSVPKFYTDDFWNVTFDTPKGRENPL